MFFRDTLNKVKYQWKCVDVFSWQPEIRAKSVDVFSWHSEQTEKWSSNEVLNKFSPSSQQVLNKFSTVSLQFLSSFSTVSLQFLYSFSTVSQQLLYKCSPTFGHKTCTEIPDFCARQPCSKFFADFMRFNNFLIDFKKFSSKVVFWAFFVSLHLVANVIKAK